MVQESQVHLLEAERRRRREEQWQIWERERHLREREATRLREVERHRPARVAELPPEARSSKPVGALDRPSPPPPPLPPPPPAGAPADAVPAPPPPPPPPREERPPAADRRPVSPGPLPPSSALPLRAPRPVGAPVVAEDVRRFLEMDASERFDLVGLNTLPLIDLARTVDREDVLRRKVQERARDLFARVRQEMTDLPTSSAILRELVLQWYRDSPQAPEWVHAIPPAWGGLFADSRSAGGKLEPWILRRLQTLTKEGWPREDLAGKLLRRPGHGHGIDKQLERPPAQTRAAEAAQALLDDLAVHPRAEGMARLPLVRLSELASRRDVESLNQALGMLLEAPDRGPFVLLHPNRYSDCKLVAIRAPPPGATGPALSYVLVIQTAPAPGAGTALGALDSASAVVGVPAGPVPGAEAQDPWSLSELAPEAWSQLLERTRAAHQHVTAPPADYRQRPSYRALRTLLFRNEVARRTFALVRWRGRPSGLVLLATLLNEGALAPEVLTDYEYLEAELNEVVTGDARRCPEPPVWPVPGGRVDREGDYQRGYRYRFVPEPPGPPGATAREAGSAP